MSINSALFAGASGLIANSSALAGISDNISNSNTTGYKRVDTSFQPNYKLSGGGEARYAAGGTSASSKLDVTTEGLLNPSNSNTALAIDGNGFFVVRPNPTDETGFDPVMLTRSGNFDTDDGGYLRNDAGHYLYGWPVASNGEVNADPSSVDALEAVNLTNIGGAAEATTSVRVNANLQASQDISPEEATYDSNDPAFNMASGAVTPDFQRTIEIYDTKGGVRSVTLSMLKSSTANEWHAELHVDPPGDVETGAGLNSGQIATGVLAFDTNGQIDSANTTLPSELNFIGSEDNGALGANDVRWADATGVGAQDITLDLGSAGNPGGFTQYDSPTTLESTRINGAIFGSFADVEVTDDGFVTARFTNGITRKIYQLPVATVPNPNGLATAGGAAFTVTPESGNFTMAAPGTGSSGTIQDKALENSNVDIATEFSDLIITQRAYSASSRIITTADEMMAEAIQMKR